MKTFSESQIAKLTSLFQHGATEASRALSLWLGRNATVGVDRLVQLSLADATESLGPADETLCGCIMGMTGCISGNILFCFDESSGFLLCDLLLGREVNSDTWDELETSSAMETANIVGCAYLNSLALEFGQCIETNTFSQTKPGSFNAWTPTPPQFVRDYAASILEFAVMSQATEFDTILVATTTFQIEDRPVAWSLLLIPDAPSLDAIKKVLG